MDASRRNLLKRTGMAGLAASLPLGSMGCASRLSKKQGLKDLYSKDFTIGAALSASIISQDNPHLKALIAREFNSITPENCMKWEAIRTADEGWFWDDADAFVKFGEDNKMEMVGHTLIWHSQVPDAVFKKADGSYISADALNKKIDNHITTLVGRYQGKLTHWDVTNEVIGDDMGMRKSHWFNILGDSFIDRAFNLAHEVDPKAHLVYNDYNIEQPDKRQATVEMLKRHLARGTPIQGVGIQGHLGIDEPFIDEIEKSILAFSALGLRVHFTELDIDVLPSIWKLPTAEITTRFEYRADRDPYTQGLPQAMEDKLAKRYEDLYRLFLKHADKIDRVTTWGVSDDASWLNGFPIVGRTNYPLLFDRSHQPKPAYFRVADLKR
jgi:endo-1,4-beta-xylanase